MTLRCFDVAALPAMPWKNGGGSTQEVACWPAGSGLDGFDWRASIATVAQAGPFSVFAGVDRTIVLLEGDGMQLRADGGSVDHALDLPLAPFAFAGDTALHCEPRGGPSRDFNLMVRRGVLGARVEVLRRAAQWGAVPHGLLLAVGGSWEATLAPEGAGAPCRVRCAVGEGVWWAGAPYGASLLPTGADSVLLAVRMAPDSSHIGR